MKFYFYSTPDSATPSPYWLSFRKMLAHLSRAGITRFRTWQGTHDAPEPVTEQVWHSVTEDWPIRLEIGAQG